jgi:hypothetical protein
MTSIESVTSDMEVTLSTTGFSVGIENLWVPSFGWSDDNAEAGENPHPPQYLAALQMFAWFFGGVNKCWVHLAAEMQAGKTGVINALIRMMFNTVNFRKIQIAPQSVFIVTGMNDNAWKKQTKDRMPKDIHSNVHHLKGLANVIASLEHRANSPAGFKNILVVLDESHIASSVTNIPAIVFEKMRSLAGGIENWAENNIRLVTISATDPALVIGMAAYAEVSKVVNLRTSDAYQSVEKLYSSGRIHSTISLSNEENVGKLVNIVRTTFPETPNLYHIIRTPARSKKDMIKNVLQTHMPECHVIEWDAASKERVSEEESCSRSTKIEDINDILETEPEVPTFILIKNMFYAAKTLNDEFCGILFDRPSTKDDTNLQSLLGRACGYGKNSHTHIYTSMKTVETYLEVWSRIRPTDDMIIPDTAPKSLDKKMAGVSAIQSGEHDAKLVVLPRRAIPVSPHGGAGGGGGASAAAGGRGSGEKVLISEQTFDSVALAKKWCMDNFIDTCRRVSEFKLNRETMTFQYRGEPRAVRSDEETRQLSDLSYGVSSKTGSARMMPVLVGEQVKYIVLYKREFVA